MLTKKRQFNVALTITAILALSSTACSSDSTGEDVGAVGPAPSSESNAAPNPDSDTAAGDDGSGESEPGSVYGSDLEVLGAGLQAGTNAESFTVDGNTIRLHFTEGSVEDPMAHISCSAATQLLDAEHQAILVFPDGEKDCSDGNAAPASGSEVEVGTASLTIGDHSWEFDQVTCGFGEEETGVEGSEFNLVASNGSAVVYAAIDLDNTYIEFNDSASSDPALAEFITQSDPTIEINGKDISADASFTTYEDYDTVHAGSLSATCP